MSINGTNISHLPQSGTKNWNLVYDDNVDEITVKLNGPLLSDTVESLGDTEVEDVDAGTLSSPSFTATSPTVNTISGTGDDANINTSLTNLKAQVDELIADRDRLKNQVNLLLSALRKTTGCGVLDG